MRISCFVDFGGDGNPNGKGSAGSTEPNSCTGLIEQGRSIITVTDRLGLEQAVCGCYSIMRQRFDQILQRPPQPGWSTTGNRDMRRSPSIPLSGQMSGTDVAGLAMSFGSVSGVSTVQITPVGANSMVASPPRS